MKRGDKVEVAVRDNSSGQYTFDNSHIAKIEEIVGDKARIQYTEDGERTTVPKNHVRIMESRAGKALGKLNSIAESKMTTWEDIFQYFEKTTGVQLSYLGESFMGGGRTEVTTSKMITVENLKKAMKQAFEVLGGPEDEDPAGLFNPGNDIVVMLPNDKEYLVTTKGKVSKK